MTRLEIKFSPLLNFLGKELRQIKNIEKYGILATIAIYKNKKNILNDFIKDLFRHKWDLKLNPEIIKLLIKANNNLLKKEILNKEEIKNFEKIKFMLKNEFSKFKPIKLLEAITGFKWPFKKLVVYFCDSIDWGEARPGWPIIVESIKNNDIPSIMHEASHILLRKGKQNKIYEKEEILCLFIEAMFREKIYGKFESKSKREELKILRENWNKRNNFTNIIDFAKNILQYCK